jgi:hypothetical protein
MQRRIMQASTRFALFHEPKYDNSPSEIGEKIKAPKPLPQTAIPVARLLFFSK